MMCRIALWREGEVNQLKRRQLFAQGLGDQTQALRLRLICAKLIGKRFN